MHFLLEISYEANPVRGRRVEFRETSPALP
jgi:hypothetical protein